MSFSSGVLLLALLRCAAMYAAVLCSAVAGAMRECRVRRAAQASAAPRRRRCAAAPIQASGRCGRSAAGGVSHGPWIVDSSTARKPFAGAFALRESSDERTGTPDRLRLRKSALPHSGAARRRRSQAARVSPAGRGDGLGVRQRTGIAPWCARSGRALRGAGGRVGGRRPAGLTPYPSEDAGLLAGASRGRGPGRALPDGWSSGAP